MKGSALNSRKDGFTLVELLVVISIIALLLAILLPALNNAKRQALSIVDQSRVREITNSALMWASGDPKGRLPQGGIHGIWLTDPTPTDFDDGFSMAAEDYFKIGVGIAGLSVSLPFDPPSKDQILDEATVERYKPLLHESVLKKIFVCPSFQKLLFPKKNILVSLKSDAKELKELGGLTYPAFHGWQSSPQRWTVRLGYMYLAGFETDKWPRQADWVGKATYADTLDQPGNYTIMCDRNRWNISNNWEEPPALRLIHTRKGIFFESPATSVNPSERFPDAGAVVSYLDGSVLYKQLKDCKPRQFVQLYGFPGLDFTFF